MKNSKRSTLLLLAAVALMLCLVLVVSLVSCRNGKRNMPLVGLCLRESNDSVYSDLLEDRLEEAGYRVSVAEAGNDQSRQNQQIDSFIKKEVAVLVIEPVMVSAGEEIGGKLKQAQVPAVFVNYEPEGETLELWEGFSYVGCQEEQHGILQGNLILQADNKGDLNGDGIVSCLVITGPEDDRNARLQAEGCIKGLTDGNQKVSLVDTLWGEWTKESGRKRCADALAQYGRDIEVIFCGNDTIAQGVAEAVFSGGWKIGKDYYVAGLGGTEEGMQMLLEGSLTGTVAQDMAGQTQQVIQVIGALLQGNTVDKRYYVNCAPVDISNVDQFYSE